MSGEQQPRSKRVIVGAAMMGGSWLLWAFLPFVPALPVRPAAQAMTVAVILGVSSAIFWSGAVLTGSGLARAQRATRLWRRLVGWVRSKPDSTE